ncbi:MFS transporter [Ectothiorhodospiraceae bacterium WFHF3C12]|nr:MFS transporter [Ectothiorhodospiraceae bacterium WFHF3C12]
MPAPLTLAITVLAYFVLYGPQPLLPRLADAFGVTESQTALLMTATLLPLGVAPIAYGAVLARVSSRQVLIVGVGALGLATILFALAEAFTVLLALRLAQGLVLPAVLTAMMTALSERTQPRRMQRVMSAYIASTILGGLGGRLLSGAFATYLDWTAFFIATGAALLLTLPFLWRVPAAPAGAARDISAASIVAVWLRHGNWRIYAGIFCLFFVFVGLLNFLPFRVRTLHPGASEFLIGLVYSGYVMGIVAALAANRVIAVLGSTRRALASGYVLYVAALVPALIPHLPTLFASVFLFCLGMFLVHAIASATVNETAGEQRGMVNGLYVSAYYTGGVLGSYLPGLVYEGGGWTATIAVLGLVGLVGLGLTTSYRDRPAHGPPGQ